MIDQSKLIKLAEFEYPTPIFEGRRRYTNEELRKYVSNEEADRNLGELISLYDYVHRHKMEKKLK